MSPYAAGRPLVVAILIGLALPWLAGLATGDRHVAGLVGGDLALILLGGQVPLLVVLSLAALALVGVHRLMARRRESSRTAGERLSPVVTRVLTAGGLILLVAVGVKAAQEGRLETAAHDLVAEFPLRPHAAVVAARPDLPDMYFILLDGYPRADKLQSVFGIDNTGFIYALEERGFFVASTAGRTTQ